IRRSPSAPLGRAYFAFIAVRVAGVAGRPDALLVLATETTARKQAEDELARARERAEASRAQLQAVLDQMPSGVLIAEAPSGRLMLGNTQAAHIWGGALPRAETVQGYAAYAGYHADGRPYAAEEWPLTRALQGAAVRDEEISIPRPDGTTVTTSQSAAPIRDDQGHIIAAVVVLTDISERRRVEGERERLLAASRRQRRALETTFEADPSGLAVVAGPEARFELINPAYRALTPNPEVDPLGRPFQEVWEAAMGYRTLPLIRRVLASGEPVDIPHYERTFPNGSRHDYSGHLRRLPWNETDAVLVVLWETTALERARSRALQAAEQAERHAAELAATIGAINDGLIIYGPQREVVRINDPALRLLGVGPRWPELSREERTRVTEMRTADGTPLRPGEFVRDRALRGERLAGYRVTIQQPESHERRELLLSAGPIRDREGHILGAVLNLSDVSALVALQEQREDMLRAVSHDLRNPLAGIMGQAQLCERHLAQAGLERERQRAEAIVAGAQRMNTMIQDLVDAARSESGQLQLSRQQVDLRAFLLGLKERLAASLDTARIDVQVAEGLPSVSADRARLERIMTNLWSNALKYSAPGTPVTVSARQEDGLVITSVADRGPGIAPEDLPRLFQRYFRSGTVRERREGVGLGLSITRQLVEAHGGRVWAESQVGIGSTFSFSLPVAES
nr:ATP-binding protein [Anaerolineae bacterium]